MNDLVQFVFRMFDTTDFPERWNCGNWDSITGWLFIISSWLITSSYMAIPFLLIRTLGAKIALTKKAAPAILVSVAFIAFCGIGHTLDSLMFWWPAYRLLGTWHFMTAIVSCFAACMLYKYTDIIKQHEVQQANFLAETLEFARNHDEEITINKLIRLADEMPQIIWMANKNGDTDYFNQKWEEYTGLPRTKEHLDIGDQYWIQVLHPADVERTKKLWKESLETGKPYVNEYQFKGKNGQYRWFLGRAQPVRDVNGVEILRWFGTCTDIDEQKEYESNLEEVVTERTKLLEQSNQELERFATVASHDLQDPLKSMNAFLKLIASRYSDPIANEYIQIVMDSNIQMQRMIKNLLEYARVQTRQLNIRDVDSEEVIDQIMLSLMVLSSSNATSLIKKNLPMIETDETGFRQIVQNLIQNGFKYGGDTITVDCQEINEEVVFTVSDNGPPIPDHLHDHIFDIHRSFGQEKHTKGLGFGLSICRRITEGWGGRIWLETSESGNVFKFTISSPKEVDM